MRVELVITVTAVFFGFISFIVSMFCFRYYRRQQYYLETYSNDINHLEAEISENIDLLKESSIHLSDQACRIAWLENNIRRPQKLKSEFYEDGENIPLREDNSLNITQRKQKILSLSKNGYDSKTIAANLGLMPGEVELILNLNRHSTSYI